MPDAELKVDLGGGNVTLEAVADSENDAASGETLATLANVDYGLRTRLDTLATLLLTETQLRSAPVEVNDDYSDGETLADQSGTAEVKTFTFSSAVDLIVIYPSESGGRADPFGGTPSSTAGIVLLDDAPNYITVTATAVDIYIDSGTVSVWGFRH